jgi:hypothetical protein
MPYRAPQVLALPHRPFGPFHAPPDPAIDNLRSPRRSRPLPTTACQSLPHRAGRFRNPFLASHRHAIASLTSDHQCQPCTTMPHQSKARPDTPNRAAYKSRTLKLTI